MEKNQGRTIESELGNELISWEFPEFNQFSRSNLWYIMFGALFLALTAYGYFTKNFLFIAIIFLIIFIYFLTGNRNPLIIRISFFDGGVMIGDKIYRYNEIEKFWLAYEPPEVKNLYIDFKHPLSPNIMIPLMEANPVKLREILIDFVEEDLEKETESTSDYLSRKLKI